MTDIISELDVCGTCMCWIANADDSSLDMLSEDEAEMERQNRDAGLSRYKGHLVPACDEDCEGGFTRSPCDICGVTGRDSHKVVELT